MKEQDPRSARQVEESLRVWSGGILTDGGDTGPPPHDDPAAVAAFTRRHGIGPLLERLRGTAAGGGELSTDSVTSLSVARELARNHEFAGVVSACRARLAGPPLVFKGQALAHSLYPAPWLRPRCDVDVLVDRDDAPELGRLLETLGYRRSVGIDADLVSRQASYHKRSAGMDHVWDVHWRISNRPAFAEVLTYHELLKRAIAVPIEEQTFAAPDPADSLLIACLHLIGHHANEIRLIWLYDIHLLAGTLTDEDCRRFVANATAEGDVQSACHTALALTARYLPSRTVDELRESLGPGSGTHRRPGRRYAVRLIEDARAVGRGNRLRLVRQHLFPSADYMIERFGIRRRWQLPWWYLRRIVRALPKLARRR